MNDNKTITEKELRTKASKTITVGETVVRNLWFETLESIAESLKSIDKSLQKIAGEKVIKTNEPHKKSYAEIYFAKDDSTGKWEEK